MKKSVVVTIGICARNCECTISDVVNSVISQDFPHAKMEIIFVDDGSKDKTNFLMDTFVQRNDINSKIFSHSWKGIGFSRNTVIKHSRGKYVLWVDGDMILSKDYVRKLVDFMEKNPGVAIAKGRQELKPGANLLSTLELLSRAASRMVDYSSEKTWNKSLGTGGSIYRTEALKQVDYFDANLKGYGEDQDVEVRIRAAGWKLAVINVTFQDYERLGVTWKSLYQRYWLRGYWSHYFFHKNPSLIRHYKMIPPAAFLNGLIQAAKLFKLTHLRRVYLLSFHNFLKMFAWYIGYINSHSDSCAPT